MYRSTVLKKLILSRVMFSSKMYMYLAENIVTDNFADWHVSRLLGTTLMEARLSLTISDSNVL